MGLIASVLVKSARKKFQDERHAGDLDARLRFLRVCAHAAQGARCQTLVLPAGFFFVEPDKRPSLEREVLGVLAGFNLLIAFGIDEGEKSTDGKSKKFDGQWSHLPNFGYIYESGRFLVEHVRQTGNRVNQVTASQVSREIHARLASSSILGGRSVAIILCGEILSPAWVEELIVKKPDLIFHPAHAEVKLGSCIREAWATRLDHLLHHLPDTSVWAFADHVMGLAHYANDVPEPLPLVRRGGRGVVTAVGNRLIGTGTVGQLYVYNTNL
jgi:hypothetical protein